VDSKRAAADRPHEGPAGADEQIGRWLGIYEGKFENGGLEFRILLSADGKIDAVGVRPARGSVYLVAGTATVTLVTGA
jgi:hypothetical protein